MVTNREVSAKVFTPLHFQAEIEAQKKVVLKMADDVEADLEAPEAMDIAREDILLSKMDQERERCCPTQRLLCGVLSAAHVKDRVHGEIHASMLYGTFSFLRWVTREGGMLADTIGMWCSLRHARQVSGSWLMAPMKNVNGGMCSCLHAKGLIPETVPTVVEYPETRRAT